MPILRKAKKKEKYGDIIILVRAGNLWFCYEMPLDWEALQVLKTGFSSFFSVAQHADVFDLRKCEIKSIERMAKIRLN